MKNIFLVLFSLIIGYSLDAQELFNKTINADNLNHLLVSNINGDIEVATSTSGQIEVKAILQDGKMHTSMSIAEKGADDFLAVYFKMPTTCEENNDGFDPERPLRVVSYFNNCNWNNTEMPPKIKFIVKLPATVNLYVSTVNNGDITVMDWPGAVWAQNVNGAISLQSVANVRQAKTVNGPVNIEYTQAPETSASFGTINGDIRVKIPGNIKATTNFKTFSGDFYTDQESVVMLPSAKITSNTDNSFKYKVENSRGMKIGGGGVRLNFETFNGNAYLTEL